MRERGRARAAAVLLGCVALASAVVALPADAPGVDAPALAVDRFSDEAGTLFRRSAVPGLPGPGEPIDL
ncbi:MAG TPA: hypothetical protein VE404_04330, partial [Verrucomicrobiae bacterium]|nr:hypothetical protein [Verrucomicrobiae bacterium]